MPRPLYPIAGTHAETILNYVQANEGTTTYGIITGLDMNPSVVRKCLRVLAEKGVLIDRRDKARNHRWSAKAPAL